jgi:hypothetical protein
LWWLCIAVQLTMLLVVIIVKVMPDEAVAAEKNAFM